MVFNKKIEAQLEAALEDKDEHHVVYIPISFIARGNPTTSKQAQQCAPSSFGLAVLTWLKERHVVKLFFDRDEELHLASSEWIKKVSLLHGLTVVDRFPENGDRIDEVLKLRVPEKVIPLMPEKSEPKPSDTGGGERVKQYPEYKHYSRIDEVLAAFAGSENRYLPSKVRVIVRLDGDLRFVAARVKSGAELKKASIAGAHVYNYLVRQGFDVCLQVMSEPKAAAHEWLARHELRVPREGHESSLKLSMPFAELMLRLSIKPNKPHFTCGDMKAWLGDYSDWEVGRMSGREYKHSSEESSYTFATDKNRQHLLRQMLELTPQRSTVVVKLIPDLCPPRYVGHLLPTTMGAKQKERIRLINAIAELNVVEIERAGIPEPAAAEWLIKQGISHHGFRAPDTSYSADISFTKLHLQWLQMN